MTQDLRRLTEWTEETLKKRMAEERKLLSPPEWSSS